MHMLIRVRPPKVTAPSSVVPCPKIEICPLHEICRQIVVSEYNTLIPHDCKGQSEYDKSTRYDRRHTNVKQP